MDVQSDIIPFITASAIVPTDVLVIMYSIHYVFKTYVLLSALRFTLTNIYQYPNQKEVTDNITRSNQKENVKFTNKSRMFYLMHISLLLIIKISFMTVEYNQCQICLWKSVKISKG